MPEPMPDKTPMFDRAIPVLAALEIATSLDYFHKLGFETHDFGDNNYGFAIREHIEIHFWLCADRHVAENTSCYVRVNDIHALHADFARRFDVGEVVETPVGHGRTVCVRPERQPGEVRSKYRQARPGGRRAGSAFGLNRPAHRRDSHAAASAWPARRARRLTRKLQPSRSGAGLAPGTGFVSSRKPAAFALERAGQSRCTPPPVPRVAQAGNLSRNIPH